MDNQGPNNYNNGNNNYNNNGGNGGGGNGNNGGNGGRDNHNGQLIMAFVLVSLIVLFIMSMVSNRFSQMSTQEISYSQFLEKVEAGEVKSVEIGSYEIDITPVTKDKSPYQPTYYCGRVADEDLIPLLKEKGVEIYGVIPDNTSTWIYSILSYLIPLVLIWVLLGFLMKRMGGGAMGVGKSNAKVYVEKQTGVTFKDVAGQDEAKESLQEVVDFLHNPKKYSEIGAKLPKGALLVGPPGTGKTLLAKAVAGEAKVPFFSLAGSDFVEMFVGIGASRVRDLFEQAKKNSPSIVFIDEIDAVGRHRGAGLGGGHDEREQTLNQLLVEMDGFGTNSGVIVIAATNRRDILDPALLRPGRFDRQIAVGYPDIKGREAILRVHTKNKPIGPDVNLKTIAASTAGFTGADLENLTNEAALLAAKKNHKAITMVEIEEATIKVIAGPEKKSHVVTEKDKKLTSYHEAGHAVCTYYLPTQDPVHQISIVPRGMAGGYTLSLPGEDKTYVTKREMNEDIVTLLGGRVAEKLVLDDISTGASNDIERATKVARNMVVRYGFSEKLGPIVYGHDDNEVFLGRDFSSTPSYSETVAAEIDAEIREIIDTAYERAVDILTEHMGQLHEIAKYLFENEKMDEKTFADMMAGKNTVNLEKSADSTEQDSAQTAVSVEEAADEAGQDPTV